jgi:hypothetical protein
MNNKNINEFFNDLFLDKFLVNFFPGLILFFVLATFVSFPTGDGVLWLFIVAIGAWILGMIVEMIFYRKTYIDRRAGATFTVNESLNLLFSKIGLCIIIATIIYLVFKITQMVIYEDLYSRSLRKENEVALFFTFIKSLFFVVFGIFLYRRYPKK